MILFTIAYLAGALTILSPCILPVLPFVFSRAGQPFARSVLPMLIGMVITFAGVPHSPRLVVTGRYRRMWPGGMRRSQCSPVSA